MAKKKTVKKESRASKAKSALKKVERKVKSASKKVDLKRSSVSVKRKPSKKVASKKSKASPKASKKKASPKKVSKKPSKSLGLSKVRKVMEKYKSARKPKSTRLQMPSVTRKQFIKTAGVGAAAMGVATYGLGGVARAETIPPMPAAIGVTYLGADRETKGEWFYYDENQQLQLNYGNCGWILSAFCANPPNQELPIPFDDYRYYDLFGGDLLACPDFDYQVFVCEDEENVGCDKRALIIPETASLPMSEYVGFRRPTGYWVSDKMTITLNIPGTPGTDNYRLAVYICDIMGGNRQEKVTVTNPTPNPNDPNNAPFGSVVFDSVAEGVTNFHNGIYVLFDVTAGNGVTIDIEPLAGNNAVVSGIFLDPDPSIPDYSATAQHSPDRDEDTQGDWIGEYGKVDEGGWYLLCAMNSTVYANNAQQENQAADICSDLSWIVPALVPGESYYTSVTPEHAAGNTLGANYWVFPVGPPLGIMPPCASCIVDPDKIKMPAYAWALKDVEPPIVPYYEYGGLAVPDFVPPNTVCYGLSQGTATWASCYDDGGEREDQPEGEPDLYVRLSLPPVGPGCPASQGCYVVSFYAADWRYCFGERHDPDKPRRQQIQIYDIQGNLLDWSWNKAYYSERPAPIENRPPSPGAPEEEWDTIGCGVYHQFYMPAGEYIVKVDYYGYLNAILSGIFIECVECPQLVGFRTIGFWKHQFAVALGYNRGRAQLARDPDDVKDILDGYLEVIHQAQADCPQHLAWLPANPEAAYTMLVNPGPSNDMCAKARQQFLALWLNYANGATNWSNPYIGPMSAMDLLCELEQAMVDGDCAYVQYVADFINNSSES